MGLEVGMLSTLGHRVTGTVFIVDERHIRIYNFNYDGTAPGMKDQSSPSPPFDIYSKFSA